ncbi:MAG: primosomal protein N' [Acidobacteria bacterium]|nr:primosomal protein N' [Acidobacteriota bacterium]
MYVEIAIPLYIFQTFTYSVPEEMQQDIQVGCRCLIPFGKRSTVGYIVALHDEIDPEISPESLKEILVVIDETPLIIPEILELTHWIADYYYAPWGEVIKAALPAGINAAMEVTISVTEAGREQLNSLDASRIERSTKWKALQQIANNKSLNPKTLEKEYSKARLAAITRELEKDGLIQVEQQIEPQKTRAKKQMAVRLTTNHTIDELLRVDNEDLSSSQKRVLDYLSSSATTPFLTDLLEILNISVSVVRSLEKRGLVEVFSQTIRRNPLAHIAQPVQPMLLPILPLTDAQAEALEQILTAIFAEEYTTFLLHGVTGSGKTEIYLRAMKATLEIGKNALMLVPEIALTPVFSRRLCEYFGDYVAILHSSLSEGERFDEWQRIYRGEAKVVIGTRSAVFAPIRNLGLIVVDEEHETSYKQEEVPRYNGRDSAIMRALKAQAVVILGSATPSLETFHNAHIKKYHYLTLPERVAKRPLAKVEVVDMREVFQRQGKVQIFSDELIQAAKDALAKGEQAIIMLNRRGFSAFVICRSCGQSIRCRDCAVTLTYHKEASRLICHYCNYQVGIPKTCPTCNSMYIYYMGEGTEQIEAKVKEIFPENKVCRVDRDTTRRKGSFEKIINEFADGLIDILVGTQMLAKGHDFPNVTLVGVISVDAGLSMPDFRSAERTFQLLTQVAGRAGRGGAPGKVIIQSYHPDHYSLTHASMQNYQAFYQQEINFRRSLYYPPFSVLVNIIIKHKELSQAQALASEVGRQLRLASQDDKTIRILGPAQAPLSRLRAEHRLQILIKARTRTRAREILDIAMDKLNQAQQDLNAINIEVDPIDLM